MRIVRTLLTILAIAFAAFLAFRGCQGSAPPAPPSVPATPADTKPFAFPTLLGDTNNPAPVAPVPAAVPEPVVEVEPAPGTPVAAGATVSIAVPYKPGTKSRYRVSESQLLRDRATGAANAFRFIWEVSTEVSAVDESGNARILFHIDSFKFDTESMGRPISIDSKKPDEKLIADPDLGLDRSMRPAIAILGMPLEFTVSPAGRITNIEGVDAMNQKFLDAVETVGSKYLPDAIDAPTTERLTEKWGEFLFPALGGGTLKAGETRPAWFRTTHWERWAALTNGELRATHDDESTFRVEFRGKPELEERNIEAKSPLARGILKVRILSSADSYVSSWRFDRKSGRLLWSRVSTKYQVHVARPPNADGTPNAVFTDMERLISVDLIDK